MEQSSWCSDFNIRRCSSKEKGGIKLKKLAPESWISESKSIIGGKYHGKKHYEF